MQKPSAPQHRHSPPALHRLDYQAFRQLVRSDYAVYARARIGLEPVASAAVDEAFTAIAHAWARMLSSPSTAAAAWLLLGDTVTRHASGVPGTRSPAHRILPAPPADALLLHRGLGLPLDRTAALMGSDISAVRALIARADRELGRAREAPALRAPSSVARRAG
ncbi:hypothetical protein [Streptomyces sp. NPDC001889]